MATDPSMILVEPAHLFYHALDNAGIPIDAVSIIGADQETPPEWHIVTRDDKIIVYIGYLDEATPEQISQGDEIVMTLDLSPKRTRSVWSLYMELRLLSGDKLKNIFEDLSTGKDSKLRSIAPPQDSALLALEYLLTVGFKPNELDLIARIASIYVQQHIHYLEYPDFDPTIYVIGWEQVPGNF